MIQHPVATLWQIFCYRSEHVQAKIAQAKKNKKANPFKSIVANARGWKSFKKAARNAVL
jgi:tRNA A37 threonylcarbamoyladenosine synthetase subunit TsaC/SUA5/YrdC